MIIIHPVEMNPSRLEFWEQKQDRQTASRELYATEVEENQVGCKILGAFQAGLGV